ncbi:MAG: hypothetical protein ACREFE_08685 [Limisphaerales bacterium]
MKIYFLIPIVILTGCSSPRVVQMPSQPATVLSPEQAESVRYAESVKAYPIGRYVDPNNDLIMHGAHTIYRVETTARWNLHPNAAADASLGPPLALIDSAKYNAPVNAAVIAEVNKQKAATQALLNQSARLNQTLSQLAGTFQTVGEQNLQLKQEMTVTEKRLDALENELRNKQADSFGINQNINTNEW